jgi:hypothetical protein
MGEWPGELLVFAAGEVVSINPAKTTTPVQDAVDLAESNNGGEVWLPPGTTNEAETVTIDRNVAIKGHGVGALGLQDAFGSSVIKWPAGVDHIQITTGGVELDGFVCQGDGAGAAGADSITLGQTGGADLRNVQIGSIGIRGIYGRAMGREGVAVFQCNLGEFLHVADVDAGDENAVFDFDFGFANRFGNVAIYPTDTSSGSNSTAFYSNEFGFEAGSVNIGGTCKRVLERVSADKPIQFGYVNFEPALTSIDWAFNLQNGPTTIRELDISGEVDVVRVYHLSFGNKYTKMAKPQLWASATISGSVVEIEEEPQGPSWYYGPASDILNNAGTSTGLVRSMDSAGTGNG